MTTHWIDRVTAPLAPSWTLKRQRARMALTLLQRHYEAASAGRRTSGWRKSSGDANAVIGPALKTLRENARDLVRNNPYAESALTTIADDTVGWGIVAKPVPASAMLMKTWNAWAGTTACDADGRHDFSGLQKLVVRTVVESGEVLVRRRIRFLTDGFPVPLQLQVLDPDFLDTSKDTLSLSLTGRSAQPGNVIIQGVEFDPIGRRVAYWLFPQHPGATVSIANASVPVPAESVLHIFKPTRPGQVRAPSWFAPVLLKLKDLDEYEDATLMKQKIAACLAVITSDIDGTASPLGTVTDPTANPQTDFLEPGAIINTPAGRTITVVDPPSNREYDAYTANVLRSIATGLGVTYEDLTGDYGEMSFSAARASRLQQQERIHDWRWRMLIPQFCDPAFAWFAQAAAIMGRGSAETTATWTPPPFPMVDPVNEGLAAQRNMRSGITSLYEEIRTRGYDPEELLAEIAAGNTRLDELGIILDSDARKMTQAGQLQGAAAQPAAPAVEDPLASAARTLRLASGARP